MPKHHYLEDTEPTADDFTIIADTAVLSHPDACPPENAPTPETPVRAEVVEPPALMHSPPVPPASTPKATFPEFDFPPLPPMPLPPPTPLEPPPSPIETAVLLGIAYVLGGVTGALLASAFSKAGTGVCPAAA